MARLRKFAEPEWLNRFIPVCMVKPDILMDVGAGIRPQQLVKPRMHICVEPHGEYCEVLRRKGLRVIQGTAQQILPNVESDSVDTVTLLDVVEHLPKDESLEVLRHAKRIARKQVVILTPLGYMPQTCAQTAPDPWGLHGNTWQEHRSGWDITDFEDWDVYICDRFHVVSYQGDHHIPLDKPNGAIWAVYTKWQNLTWADRLRVKHDFRLLWLWAFFVKVPWFYPLRHQIVLRLQKLRHYEALIQHRLVVALKVKEALRYCGVKSIGGTKI